MALDLEYRIHEFRLDAHHYALQVLRQAGNGPDNSPQAAGIRRVAQTDAQPENQVPAMGRAQRVTDEFYEPSPEAPLPYQR